LYTLRHSLVGLPTVRYSCPLLRISRYAHLALPLPADARTRLHIHALRVTVLLWYVVGLVVTWFYWRCWPTLLLHACRNSHVVVTSVACYWRIRAICCTFCAVTRTRIIAERGNRLLIFSLLQRVATTTTCRAAVTHTHAAVITRYHDYRYPSRFLRWFGDYYIEHCDIVPLLGCYGGAVIRHDYHIQHAYYRHTVPVYVYTPSPVARVSYRYIMHAMPYLPLSPAWIRVVDLLGLVWHLPRYHRCATLCVYHTRCVRCAVFCWYATPVPFLTVVRCAGWFLFPTPLLPVVTLCHCYPIGLRFAIRCCLTALQAWLSTDCYTIALTHTPRYLHLPISYYSVWIYDIYLAITLRILLLFVLIITEFNAIYYTIFGRLYTPFTSPTFTLHTVGSLPSSVTLFILVLPLLVATRSYDIFLRWYSHPCCLHTLPILHSFVTLLHLLPICCLHSTHIVVTDCRWCCYYYPVLTYLFIAFTTLIPDCAWFLLNSSISIYPTLWHLPLDYSRYSGLCCCLYHHTIWYIPTYLTLPILPFLQWRYLALPHLRCTGCSITYMPRYHLLPHLPIFVHHFFWIVDDCCSLYCSVRLFWVVLGHSLHTFDVTFDVVGFPHCYSLFYLYTLFIRYTPTLLFTLPHYRCHLREFVQSRCDCCYLSFIPCRCIRSGFVFYVEPGTLFIPYSPIVIWFAGSQSLFTANILPSCCLSRVQHARDAARPHGADVPAADMGAALTARLALHACAPRLCRLHALRAAHVLAAAPPPHAAAYCRQALPAIVAPPPAAPLAPAAHRATRAARARAWRAAAAAGGMCLCAPAAPRTHAPRTARLLAHAPCTCCRALRARCCTCRACLLYRRAHAAAAFSTINNSRHLPLVCLRTGIFLSHFHLVRRITTLIRRHDSLSSTRAA